MTNKPTERLNEPKLKELIVDRLRETASDENFMVDREKCFAEAADRVLESIKLTLFTSPDEAGTGSDQIDPTVPVTIEKNYEDFVNIRKKLVEEIRIGYLAGNLQMMKALGAAVAVRDTGSGEHNHRVTLYAVKLAEALGLTNGSTQTLIKGSFLHDLGKISISDNILLKPEKLTEEEIARMKSHPCIGAKVLSEVKWLEDTYQVVVSHHEKYDGSGYPDGLKGEEIPEAARIFAIVDVFDALISERPYKAAYPYGQVIDYMKRQSGSHFDPETLSVFLGISRRMYDEIATQKMDELEKKVSEIIDRHFQIDLSLDRFRSKHSGM